MSVQTLETDYAGRRWPLFRLALKSSLLTVLTLGFYRFWMKTRLRRFYWSAIRPGGVPLEYTGTGLEKLMGFLVAVVVMAFYIGIVNLILVFFSLSVLNDSFTAYALSFVGVVPIYFYAQYRARRYVLARTRWRGLRFGIEPAAWSYAWRALLHWLATILSLGILLPRQVFWLEKFRIDRTWYGQARFHQGGRWTMLLRDARQMYIGMAITALSIAGGLWFDEGMFALLAIGLPWLVIGFLRFRVGAFRRMAAEKRLGEGLAFRARPRTGRVLGIYVFGGLLTYGSLILFLGGFLALALILVSLIEPSGINGYDFTALFRSPDPLLRWGAAGGAALGYFSLFILWGVLSQTFITLPMLRHYAETVTVTGSHHLPAISQRARDAFSEAEGFAEALDIGAAI